VNLFQQLTISTHMPSFIKICWELFNNLYR